jgi:hypothetical protein
LAKENRVLRAEPLLGVWSVGGCADIMAAVANRIDARQMRWEVESAKVFNSSTARVE